MDSAEYFGFATEHTEKKNERVLSELVAGMDSQKRVKLVMDSQGEFSGEIKDFQPNNKVLQVCLANQPVNSNDRFLFHKTTNRAVYEQAAIQGFDDVLLFNEKNELTEFTIGNLVVQLKGELFTPPIECCLLAGTFRAELVASGEVKERVLKKQDAAKFEAVFLVNSLRKWVKVNIN